MAFGKMDTGFLYMWLEKSRENLKKSKEAFSKESHPQFLVGNDSENIGALIKALQKEINKRNMFQGNRS